jgi:hypothetical protein
MTKSRGPKGGANRETETGRRSGLPDRPDSNLNFF